MKTKFFKQTLLGALVAVLASASQAGVLLGNGTYTQADDLTRIQTGSTSALNFLDLSRTIGMSPAQAMTAYGAAGFRWADMGEVSELIAAFGATFTGKNGGISMSVDQSRLISGYLGETNGRGAALGWLDDGDAASLPANSYICFNCNTSSFLNLNGSFQAPNATVGVFLVRDESIAGADSNDVPEPGTLALAGLTLGLLAATRRRRA